jgi:hypothetical protein
MVLSRWLRSWVGNVKRSQQHRPENVLGGANGKWSAENNKRECESLQTAVQNGISLVASDIEKLRRAEYSGSVRLNMTPSGLQISVHSYTLTTSAIHKFDFPAAGTTVQSVKNLILDKGRDRYEMTESGGCQWWWYVTDFNLYCMRGSDLH